MLHKVSSHDGDRFMVLSISHCLNFEDSICIETAACSEIRRNSRVHVNADFRVTPVANYGLRSSYFGLQASIGQNHKTPCAGYR